jgi:hypothetical protein
LSALLVAVGKLVRSSRDLQSLAQRTLDVQKIDLDRLAAEILELRKEHPDYVRLNELEEENAALKAELMLWKV